MYYGLDSYGVEKNKDPYTLHIPKYINFKAG